MSTPDRHWKINRPLILTMEKKGNTIFFALLFLSFGNNVACIVTRRECVKLIVPLANLKSMLWGVLTGTSNSTRTSSPPVSGR